MYSVGCYPRGQTCIANCLTLEMSGVYTQAYARYCCLFKVRGELSAVLVCVDIMSLLSVTFILQLTLFEKRMPLGNSAVNSFLAAMFANGRSASVSEACTLCALLCLDHRHHLTITLF